MKVRRKEFVLIFAIPKFRKKEPGQETNPKYFPTDGQYYAWHNINFGTIWHNITRHNTISTCFHPEEWHEI